jgi:hypothetical protein
LLLFFSLLPGSNVSPALLIFIKNNRMSLSPHLSNLPQPADSVSFLPRDLPNHKQGHPPPPPPTSERPRNLPEQRGPIRHLATCRLGG